MATGGTSANFTSSSTTAHKHERKRIVSVRVRICRQTGGEGELTEGWEWVGSGATGRRVVGEGEGEDAPITVAVSYTKKTRVPHSNQTSGCELL